MVNFTANFEREQGARARRQRVWKIRNFSQQVNRISKTVQDMIKVTDGRAIAL